MASCHAVLGVVSSTSLHTAALTQSSRRPVELSRDAYFRKVDLTSLMTQAPGVRTRSGRRRRGVARASGTQVVEEAAESTSQAATEVASRIASASTPSSENSSLFSQEGSSGGSQHGKRPLRLLIAGGGIGGLVLALAAKNKGMDVTVFERDLSAVRGEGQYRGPIQIQSNALAALEAVDKNAAEDIMAHGCVTGDRINGLVDGISGDWYCKFDTFTPAVEKGLPVTRVISRVKLQEILSGAVGSKIIENGANVVDFVDHGTKVTAVLEDGRTFDGDILVGADGIRSKVRNKLLGMTEAVYSDYTCYTGIADFVPADIDTVGYRVFLGHKQYFVSSDVGQGRMQWYAFYNEAAGGVDPPGGRQARLLKLFGNWCDKVVDLLLATPEEQILRRDIYDRAPIFTWSKGLVTLLGDSAHAMQPNLGQGGCMAIEYTVKMNNFNGDGPWQDAFQLGLDLGKAMEQVNVEGKEVDLPKVLKMYEAKRRVRVGVIHGLARMAAIMATTYKPYLGEGLGPLSFLQALRIPHPGRVGGRFFIAIGMPAMLGWVLGGNRETYNTPFFVSFALEGRAPYCRLQDKADSKLKKWFWNNDALERATKAEWYLLPEGERLPAEGNVTSSGKQLLRIGGPDCRPTVVGSVACEQAEEEFLVLDVKEGQVAEQHARFRFTDGALFLTDLDSKMGTWIRSVDGGRYKLTPRMPVRVRSADFIEFGPEKQQVTFRVKLRKWTAVV